MSGAEAGQPDFKRGRLCRGTLVLQQLDAFLDLVNCDD